MRDAREAVLTRIRERLSRSESASRLRSYAAISRQYRQAGSLGQKERIALLFDRLADYGAEVIEVEEQGLAAAINRVLALRGERVLLVPARLPEAWLPAGVKILRDAEDANLALTPETLTRAQAVLTPCAGAIAETGTILLQHGPEHGRRVITLLPDHHICVLRSEQISETVSEGLKRIDAAEAKPITMISGPSATADIEMTRIAGVHGPRRLTVALLH